MSSPPKITRVRMPADDGLFPAHVVATRPEIEGQPVQRGDYVLSIETPRGARNVLAPVDGILSIQVELMQDMTPECQMFAVTQTDPKPDVSATSSKEASAPPTQTKSSPEGVGGSKTRWGIKQILFCLIILALAIFLPGLVFGILGGRAGPNLPTAVVAASLGCGLLIFTWLATKVRVISGMAKSTPLSIIAVLLFAVALIAGTTIPSLRQLQQEVASPVTELAMPDFGALFDTLGIQQAPSTQSPRTVVELPNVEPTSSSASDPLLGDIILVGFNFCPRGWIAADGQLLPLSKFEALYAILGTTYGGDGRTTFAIPDLRGRAPMHAGAGPTFGAKLLGQNGSSERIAATTGNTSIPTGAPYVAMNYCLSVLGRFPPRS